MELIEVARRLRKADRSSIDPLLLSAFEHAADGATQWRAGLPTEVVFCTFSALRDIAELAGDDFADNVYRLAAAILDSALDIGNRADPVAVETVVQRMKGVTHRSLPDRRDEAVLAVM
jgi:hypothetical protein